MSVKKIAVVGAGPVGCLLALQLCRRGFEVELFERRPDIRNTKIPAGRSINLALSLRGIHALAEMGIEKEILKNAIPMLGRMIHPLGGAEVFQRYGMDDTQYINSISRAELNRALLNAAEKEGRCQIFFEHRLTGYDFEKKTLHFHNEKNGETLTRPAGQVIGSDGSASELRKSLLEHTGAQASEELLDYGYKELTIPPGAAGRFQIEKQALHIWPRGKFMLIALPNKDGSFTCTLFLPFRGEESFENFSESPEGRVKIRDFFDRFFPDAAALIPNLEEAMVHNPLGKMVTVKSDRWHVNGQALLIGDAAHAIVPFFGQGLNCSFEDCTLLNGILEKDLDLDQAFAAFFRQRKADADAIAQLAQENFIEMRDKVAQPRFLLEKEIEKRLMKEFPDAYVSRYSLVTFSRRPYRQALLAGQAQDKILNRLSEGLSSAADVDMSLAKSLITQYQRELNPSL